MVQCDTFHSHLLIFISFPFKKIISLTNPQLLRATEK
nr:MAG TPA: hypothetical protein [Caudoviricetes sp.]